MSERMDRIEKMLTFGWIEPDARSVMRELLELIGEQSATCADLTDRIEQLESKQRYSDGKVGR